MINNYSTDQSHNGPQPYKEDGKWYEPIYGTDEDGCHAEVDRVEMDSESYIAWLERNEALNAKFQKQCQDFITTVESIAKSEKKASSEIRMHLKDAQGHLDNLVRAL